MKDEPLLPCPFCNGRAYLNKLKTGIEVEHKFDCFIMGIIGSKYNGKHIFHNNAWWIEKWNTRTKPQEWK